MATYKIPVIVEYCAVLDVTADTLDEALSTVEKNPTDSYRKAERQHDKTSEDLHVEIDWELVDFHDEFVSSYGEVLPSEEVEDDLV